MRLNLNISTIHGRRNVFLKENAGSEKKRKRGETLARSHRYAIGDKRNGELLIRDVHDSSRPSDRDSRGKSRPHISSRCRGAQRPALFSR